MKPQPGPDQELWELLALAVRTNDQDLFDSVWTKFALTNRPRPDGLSGERYRTAPAASPISIIGKIYKLWTKIKYAW